MLISMLIPGITMLIIDVMYLYSFGGRLFVKQIEVIQKSKFQMNIAAAIASYGLMTFGLHYFVLRRNTSLYQTVRDAALLGIVIYGVFDATNIAIFKDYELVTGMIDTAWGGVLMALTSIVVRQV